MWWEKKTRTRSAQTDLTSSCQLWILHRRLPMSSSLGRFLPSVFSSILWTPFPTFSYIRIPAFLPVHLWPLLDSLRNRTEPPYFPHLPTSYTASTSRPRKMHGPPPLLLRSTTALSLFSARSLPCIKTTFPWPILPCHCNQCLCFPYSKALQKSSRCLWFSLAILSLSSSGFISTTRQIRFAGKSPRTTIFPNTKPISKQVKTWSAKLESTMKS